MTRFAPQGLSRAVGLAFGVTCLAALVAGATYVERRTHAEASEPNTLSKTVLAPDGKTILWELTERAAESHTPRTRIQIWESSRPPIYRRLANALTGNASRSPTPRYLTRPDDDAFDPRFTPGEDGVSFRSARGAGAVAQVWVLSLRGGEGEAWTRSPTDVEAYAWASDGSLYYVANVASELAMPDTMSRDGGETTEPARSIWRVPPGGETTERLEVSDPGIDEIALSFDDAHLIYSSDAGGDPRGGGEHDLWIVDLPAGSPRRLTNRPGSEQSPCWSEDGQFVYFLAPKGEGNAPVILFSVSIEGGEVAPVVPSFDRPIRELVSCPGSDKLFGVVLGDSTATLYRFHPKSHKAFALVESVGDVSHISPKSNGDKLSFVWRAPGASPGIATWSFPDDYVEPLPSSDSNATGDSDSTANHSDTEETNDG